MNIKLKEYIFDKRFYVPFGIILVFEIVFQFGIYDSFLLPGSSGELIQATRERIKGTSQKTQILILGTSVAKKAVNVKTLNEDLKKNDILVQSAAAEGASILIQHMLYRDAKEKLPEMKTVMHLVEISLPMSGRPILSEPHRSMVSRFPRRISIPLMFDYDFNIRSHDIFYLIFRTVNFQRDMRDFILNPVNRLQLLKKRRQSISAFYNDNKILYKLSAYPARTFDGCREITAFKVPDFDKNGVRITSDRHRKRVRDGCLLYEALSNLEDTDAKQSKRLFFKRLKLFYQEILSDGRTVTTVFLPMSDLLENYNGNKMLDIWQRELQEFAGEKRVAITDLRFSLPDKNRNDLFSDIAHLNMYGAAQFTAILRESIRQTKRLNIISKSQ